jgi:hypothetical protein
MKIEKNCDELMMRCGTGCRSSGVLKFRAYLYAVEAELRLFSL